MCYKILAILFCAVAFFSCETEGQMMNNNVMLSSNHNILETGNAYWLATHRLSTMFQESGSSGSYPQTAVTADNDPVGFMYDLGVNGIFNRNPNSSADRPLLKSDATINSFIQFDGTSDRTICQAGQKFFNPIHSTNPVFTLMVKLKFNSSDGTNIHVMTNNDGSNNPGFRMLRNTSNKMIFSAHNGTTSIYTVTSTTNFNIAAGWLSLIVSVDGTGTGVGRLVVINSSGTVIEDQSFNNTGTGTSNDASQALYIGGRTTAVQYFPGGLAHMIIKPVSVTENMISEYAVYNPSRTTQEFPVVLAHKYDIDDSDYLYKDAAETTHPADGDLVRVIKNKKTSNFGDLQRDINAASDAAAPTYRATQQNGLGALEFTPAASVMTMEAQIGGELGGKYVFFVVFQNRDSVYGSQFLNHNDAGTSYGRYVVVTGHDYSSEDVGTPRFVIHPIGADAIAVPAIDGENDNCEVYAFRRNGSAFELWNQNLVSYTETITEVFAVTHLGGDDSLVDGNEWWTDGFFVYLEKYNGYMTDVDIEARITELKTLYGL